MLRFQIDSGDKEIEKHINTAKNNATYISKTSANGLINHCGNEIFSILLKQINEAKYYCILFDETTDVSYTSQLSLSVRYIFENSVREDFVGFVDIFKDNYASCNNHNSDADSDGDIADTLQSEPIITGEILGLTVVKKMKSLGLDLLKCVGIGCDGCSVNMSTICGAAVTIQKSASNAMICPCLNHSLNNNFSKSNKVQSVRNAIGTMQEITKFINVSAKRNFILKKYLGYQLSSHCITRWVERHDSLLEFINDLPIKLKSLTEISSWHDISTSSKANSLCNVIQDSEFVMSIFCLNGIMCLTRPLSILSQNKNLDIFSATRKIKELRDVLGKKREMQIRILV